MSARQSAAADRALRSIASGMSMYAAAKKHKLAYSTVWRAVQRQAKAVRAAQNGAVFEVLGTHEELRRDQKLRAAGIKPRPLLGQLPEEE